MNGDFGRTKGASRCDTNKSLQPTTRSCQSQKLQHISFFSAWFRFVARSSLLIATFVVFSSFLRSRSEIWLWKLAARISPRSRSRFRPKILCSFLSSIERMSEWASERALHALSGRLLNRLLGAAFIAHGAIDISLPIPRPDIAWGCHQTNLVIHVSTLQ